MWILRVRLVKPAFLSLAGTIVPFTLAWSLNTAGTPEDYGPRFFFAFLFNGIGLLILLFGLGELFDQKHHRFWGSSVAFFAGLAGFFLAWYARAELTLEFLVYLVGPAVSFLGGLLGVFWKTQGTQMIPRVGLVGPARLVLIGGSVLLVLSVPFLLTPASWLSLFTLPALIVVISGILLYRTQVNRRVLGVLVVAGSVSAGFPFYVILVQGVSFNTYYVWSLLATAGTVLGLIGGVQAIRSGSEVG